MERRESEQKSGKQNRCSPTKTPKLDRDDEMDSEDLSSDDVGVVVMDSGVGELVEMDIKVAQTQGFVFSSNYFLRSNNYLS